MALNFYLALSIVGTTLLMIDPGDTYVSAFIGPLMSVLLPAHVMYIAIVFALPQMIYLALALEIVLAYKRHQLQEQKDPS